MRFSLFLFIIILCSCNSAQKELTAQDIIDISIKKSGMDKVSNASITFDFRDRSYKADRKIGVYKLQRYFENDTITIEDYITNDSYKRFVNNKLEVVADSMNVKYSNSINSVHYFSVLPFGLNDAAVHKKKLPDVTIKGKEYYKIEIRFSENGGGEDFQDVFIYWINKQSFLIDYLAYEYQTNGGGKRFRVATKQQLVNDILFKNYDNYKPKLDTINLIDLDKAYQENNLIKISEINLENITVKL